jgi:hypothetical protein
MDLLFVVDNSISMADKQAIMAKSVPGLVQGLINPVCVDVNNPTVTQPGPGATLSCPSGFRRDFTPVNDIHIGVTTSSLGTHGGQYCDETVMVQVPMPPHYNLTLNDKAHLLAKVRSGLYSFNNAGFLAWEPGDASLSVHERDAATLVTDFTNMVTAAGETGCGYEAPLESWYRFLIDPHPPDRVELDSTTSQAVLVGEDTELLAERAAFLRPDSLLAVFMLTDENDCSIVDGGYGWLTSTYRLGTRLFNMPRGTSACASQGPNSPCCQSCIETKTAPGCPLIAQDSECLKGSLTPAEDLLNLRCWDQKRRFGMDLLYPTSRYTEGLSSATLTVRDAYTGEVKQLVPNPLYAGTNRSPSLVFLIGIVGVPWQDIATAESLSGSGLKYLTADELNMQNRWRVILGDPSSGVLPTDPLMLETPVPRTGTSPIVNVPLAPVTSTNPKENPINGHEYHAVADLQYACIFQLEVPRDCTIVAEDKGCECKPRDLTDVYMVPYNKPLCQPPSGGPAGTTQYFAPAYPGLRELQVLQDFGSNSVVTSICPKQTTGVTDDPSYGYNPALRAFIDRVRGALQ